MSYHKSVLIVGNCEHHSLWCGCPDCQRPTQQPVPTTQQTPQGQQPMTDRLTQDIMSLIRSRAQQPQPSEQPYQALYFPALNHSAPLTDDDMDGPPLPTFGMMHAGLVVNTPPTSTNNSANDDDDAPPLPTFADLMRPR